MLWRAGSAPAPPPRPPSRGGGGGVDRPAVQQVQHLCQKGEEILYLGGGGRGAAEWPGRRKDASQRRQQLTASSAVSAPDVGSRAGTGVAADPLAVPGPSGLSMRQEKKSPSVPAEESAAAAEPADESAAMVSAGEPAATQEQPELVSEPAAAKGKSWVMNPAISPKVIVNMTREGSVAKAAAKAAAPPEGGSRESLPGLESSSAARQAAAESATPPPGAASGPAVPAAAAQGKRKASAGGVEGSQKRKKPSPAGQ
jgi:hypothetical protein